MLDFLRERGTSVEEKRREALSAYLDNALTAAERERLERQLAGDKPLRDELERMRLLKLQMRAMPRRRVPRSFALDPALYGRPKAQPMMQLYPVLRGATALTAFLLIFTLALGAFQGQPLSGGETSTAAVEVAMEEAAVEEPAAAEMVEEAAQLAEPETAGAEERAMPTEAAADEAPVPELAPEEITGTFSIEALPPVQATTMPGDGLTTTPIPNPELALETEEIGDVASVDQFEAPADTAAGEPVESAGEEAANQSVADATGTLGSMLRPIQIGLGIALVLLLILWLVARRRIRSI